MTTNSIAEEEMTITVTPDLAEALTDHARRQGTTPEVLALQSLRTQFLPPSGPSELESNGGSLADFLADHIGVLHSSEHEPGGANLSEDCGKKFAKGIKHGRASDVMQCSGFPLSANLRPPR